MVRVTSILVVLVFGVSVGYSQTLSPERVTTWENAGLTDDVEAPTHQVLITDFGADNSGYSNSNEAYNLAVESLGGHAGTIVFPAGEYLFTATLIIPDSVFLKGESSDTKLEFDLGGSGHLIQMVGGTYSTEYELAHTAIKGSNTITLHDASDFQVGNFVRLGMFDEDLMFSSWAYGTFGQVVEISAISGNTLTLADPLNHNYPISREPFLRKQTPVRAAGIECLTIERDDETSSQTSNIYIRDAFNCVVRNVESEHCNFGHVDIRSSSHVLVEGSYFHHAHAYGGGGQGYGVVLHSTSSFCLASNNVFEHLRHSMLLQSGANGNVFGYNYSYDPHWEDGWLPANSAGDAVLHGNYTYLNLFEGNTVQHIVIDASHGSNGPYNTFLRNRAELYGFFSDPNTVTDSMNVIGNEITGSGFPFGNFMLNGNGHYSYGNNHSGAETPLGTSNLTLNSLCINGVEFPEFLNGQSLPMVGYPLEMNDKLLPAEERYNSGEEVNCSSQVITTVSESIKEPKPLVLVGNELSINPNLLPASVHVYTIDGKLLQSATTSQTSVPLNLNQANGLVLIRVDGKNGKSATLKVGMIRQ